MRRDPGAMRSPVAEGRLRRAIDRAHAEERAAADLAATWRAVCPRCKTRFAVHRDAHEGELGLCPGCHSLVKLRAEPLDEVAFRWLSQRAAA